MNQTVRLVVLFGVVFGLVCTISGKVQAADDLRGNRTHYDANLKKRTSQRDTKRSSDFSRDTNHGPAAADNAASNHVNSPHEAPSKPPIVAKPLPIAPKKPLIDKKLGKERLFNRRIFGLAVAGASVGVAALGVTTATRYRAWIDRLLGKPEPKKTTAPKKEKVAVLTQDPSYWHPWLNALTIARSREQQSSGREISAPDHPLDGATFYGPTTSRETELTGHYRTLNRLELLNEDATNDANALARRLYEKKIAIPNSQPFSSIEDYSSPLAAQVFKFEAPKSNRLVIAIGTEGKPISYEQHQVNGKIEIIARRPVRELSNDRLLTTRWQVAHIIRRLYEEIPFDKVFTTAWSSTLMSRGTKPVPFVEMLRARTAAQYAIDHAMRKTPHFPMAEQERDALDAKLLQMTGYDARQYTGKLRHRIDQDARNLAQENMGGSLLAAYLLGLPLYGITGDLPFSEHTGVSQEVYRDAMARSSAHRDWSIDPKLMSGVFVLDDLAKFALNEALGYRNSPRPFPLVQVCNVHHPDFRLRVDRNQNILEPAAVETWRKRNPAMPFTFMYISSPNNPISPIPLPEPQESEMPRPTLRKDEIPPSAMVP